MSAVRPTMAAACSMFSDEHTCGTSSGRVWNPGDLGVCKAAVLASVVEDGQLNRLRMQDSHHMPPPQLQQK